MADHRTDRAPGGLFGIVHLYRGEVHWRNEVALDGLIALFAGLIAFVAIMIQLETERNARTGEAERQRRAVATAVLLEIDDFCMHFAHLYDALLNLDQQETEKGKAFMKFVPVEFTVYPSVADKLGDLGTEATSAVVKFYNKASAFNHYFQLGRSAEGGIKPFPLINLQGEQGNQQIRDYQTGHESNYSDLSFAIGEVQQLIRDLAESAGQARDSLHKVASISLPGVDQLHEVEAKYAQKN